MRAYAQVLHAWLWPGEQPNLEVVLAEEARACGGDDPSSVAMHEQVARRLLGPLHEAAVREALGCLIPEELDPVWDGQRRQGRSGPVEERAGVFMQAGQWRVDVAQEQALARRGPLRKDLLEFFLWVGRHVARQLEISCVLGSVGLGERIGVARTGAAGQACAWEFRTLGAARSWAGAWRGIWAPWCSARKPRWRQVS